MTDNTYAQNLKEFREQLLTKQAERHAEMVRWDTEIENLKVIIKMLETLAGQTPANSSVSAKELDGLILDIFQQNPTAKFSRKEILKKLLDTGADLSGFSNRMAYVHTSVGRLYKKGILNREWKDIPDSTKKRAIYSLKKKEIKSWS